MLRKLLAILVAMLYVLGGTVPVFAQSAPNHASDRKSTGAVYVMTNEPSGNRVIAFSRESDGTLTELGTFSTGGLGSGIGVTVPPDPLGSQNSLLLSPDGKWLFAANAGSDEVSVLRVTSNGLKLVDRASSEGSYPVSLTYHDGLLYVLNAQGQGSISGFRVDDEGQLHPINNSNRSLDANTPDDGSQPQILESPGMIGFNPDGNFLFITDKGGVSGTGRMLVFSVGVNGRLSDTYQAIITADPVPFSFVFDPSGRIVVADAATGSVTAYDISADGSLTAASSVVTGQAATCWIASNGQYLFTDNTGSGTVSAIQANDSLGLLNAVAADTGAGSLPLDMGISRDGQFLYSLETGAGSVGAFAINADGSLTSLGNLGSFAPVGGAQGIAVR